MKQHQHFPSSALALTIIPALVGGRYGVAVSDDDNYGSPSFPSYARTGEGFAWTEDSDDHIERSFHDLAENVAELVSLPAGVPVSFMDREE